MQDNFKRKRLNSSKLMVNGALLLPLIGIVLSEENQVGDFLFAFYVPLLVALAFLVISVNIIENNQSKFTSIKEDVIYPLRHFIAVGVFGILWALRYNLPYVSAVFALVYLIVGMTLNALIAHPFTIKYGNFEITPQKKHLIEGKGFILMLLFVSWPFWLILSTVWLSSDDHPIFVQEISAFLGLVMFAIVAIVAIPTIIMYTKVKMANTSQVAKDK